MMDSTTGYGGWGMGFGWVFMLLFWALVFLGIAALAKWLWGSGGRTAKTALRTLEERYARGEIGREEFEQKKRDLS